MRTLALVLASLLLSTATAADAKPRKLNAKKAAAERFVLECVDERTGPTDGLDTDEAFKLCRGIVRHQAKIDKLVKRAADARHAGIARLAKRLELECAEEVSIACEDTTLRDEDHGECSDATLESKHAFDVCRGKAPVAEVK